MASCPAPGTAAELSWLRCHLAGPRRHDAAARSAQIGAQRRSPRRLLVFHLRGATRTRSPPPWQPRWDGASRSCSPPRPRTRTGPSPSPGASRTTKNRPTGMRGIRQSGERSPRPEAHAGTCVLLMVQDLHIRVINADTGEPNRELVLNPENP